MLACVAGGFLFFLGAGGGESFDVPLGSKGWRRGDSAPTSSPGLFPHPFFEGKALGTRLIALASHQFGSGSNPGVDAICGLSLLLVFSFAPIGFSPGIPVFPSPQKSPFPNSNSTRNQVDEEPLCGCATSKSLFIYLFIYL